jgi:hypothetical protein
VVSGDSGLNAAAVVLILLSAFYSIKLPYMLWFMPPFFAGFAMAFTFAKLDNLLVEDVSLFMFLSMMVMIGTIGFAFVLWFDKTFIAIVHRISKPFDEKRAQKLIDRLTAHGKDFYADYKLEYLAGDHTWAVSSKTDDGTVKHFDSKTKAIQWAIVEYFKRDHPEEYLLQKKLNRRLSAIYAVVTVLFSVLFVIGGLLYLDSILSP